MTTDTDPVTAAREAHKASCAACGDQRPCTRLRDLTAALRQAELEARVQITAGAPTR